jgi:hypothetical protein
MRLITHGSPMTPTVLQIIVAQVIKDRANEDRLKNYFASCAKRTISSAIDPTPENTLAPIQSTSAGISA